MFQLHLSKFIIYACIGYDVLCIQLEAKLKSAERQRDLHNQQKSERQRIQEERIRRARQKKEKLLLDDDVISDVERDENFNNDDGKIYSQPLLTKEYLIASIA